ncbi:gamma-glutamyltransferase [Xanthobacter sp. VNH20]|uniref:gamma-glutamyltransferase n=1 Tax=Xanthobacter sp. VNH20 TaxID=3156616 RepID=UPI0032B343C2
MLSARDFMISGRSVAVGDKGMAATSHPAVTLAAVDMLRSGGNAVDAALCAAALQGVVDPHMMGIGGDCFALIAGKTPEPIAFNGSGRAPGKADAGRLRAEGLTSIPDDSPHAVTIPGAVDAWCRLAADHGTRTLDELFRPAIRAAEDGFLIHPRVAWDWTRFTPRIARYGLAAPVFLPGGAAPAVGDRLTHPRLGATLRAIANGGRAAFYEGAVAQEIVQVLKALGGEHEVEDFARAAGNYVEPISAGYRGYTLYECPPNGQGLAALLILRILEGFELSGLSAADRIHLLAEATKLAYYQRDAIVCDPDVVPVDTQAVLAESAIAAARGRIRLDRVLDPAQIDLPNHRDTAYISVVDRDGLAVSLINSVFSAFGSGIYAPGAGVLLQNRGAGFSLKEGHPNCLAPNKRPLHTIIPGMLMKNGKPVMPFGVMGGQYQATGHAHIVSQILDLGTGLQQASDAPRSFAFAGELQLEPTVPRDVAAELERRGHRIAWQAAPLGGCQAIWIDQERGVMLGASDHRKDGIALGL